MRRQVLSVFIVFMMLLGATGCKSKQPEEKQEEKPSSSSQAPVESEAPAPEGSFNALTGFNDLEAADGNRPVGIMVGNNTKSRPQYGIEQADAYLEAETEGGITRIMAIFANASRIPEALGPVRSARSPFVLMAQALDLVYAHAGGSTEGLKLLRNSNIADVDGIKGGAIAFWRDAGLKNSKGLEYSMLTSGEKMRDQIQSSAYRTTSDRTPFSFGEVTGGTPGTKLQVCVSGNETISFLYNAADQLYYKQNGNLQSGAPHQTANGTQLAVSNVLVIYADRYWENETTINFQLSSGTGIACSGGTVRDMNWSRSASELRFDQADGSRLPLSKGKTYICIVNKANASKTVTE